MFFPKILQRSVAQILLAAHVLHAPNQTRLHPLRCRGLHALRWRAGSAPWHAGDNAWAEWAGLDADKPLWHISAKRMKLRQSTRCACLPGAV
ncbi:hypothetical protein AJ88_03525 [Mesorhizobium amorphae CCBAU 01583]|nr:hypothetical protein AJ88_03525 [Mesorhizobium amorphae CCBAU 01583]